MDKPLEITFRNMERSESVVSYVEDKYAQLGRFFGHIVGTNVKIEMPHKHHHHGNHYLVTIEVSVPGQLLVASHSSDKRVRHETPLPTINDAFDAIVRRLEDYARIHREEVKHHELPLVGRIARMFPDYGFIRLTDDREIYFHKNSVVHPGFEKLENGDPVRVVMTEGESCEGPQATTVEAVHDMDLIDERTTPFKSVT